MNPLTADRFAEFYQAVYGYPPFPWQVRLAKQVCDGGEWPRAIALPTAAGKTTCLDIAVFAMACRAKGAARRIFFVVDRRIVVDQAQIHADKLAVVLDRAPDGIRREIADQLRELAEPGWLKLSAADRSRILVKRWEIIDERDEKKRKKLLAGLSNDEREWWQIRPLDVYALRGGMYRETAWVRSPLQPTVIASTVDQVGSRLLFRGYGVSDSMKPVHAALVGNDALVLLDEAHCAKPFQQTAEAVERYRGWNESPAPFCFVSITATPTGDDELFKLDPEKDGPNAILDARVNASKPAKLVRAKKNELVGTLKSEAEALMGVDLGETKDREGNVTRHIVQAVGVIVNRVKTARQLAQQLRLPPKAKKGETPPAAPKVILLTGRMRPVDRDAILRELEPLFSNSKKPLEGPMYVVATQCLEVGADLDFHALVTECASLDALRQRFGRLNRVAARPSAPAVIACPDEYAEPKEKEKDQDPVYRNSLPHAWKWLHDFSDGKDAEGGPFIDFRVTSIEEKWKDTPADRKLEVVKQSPDAPVLFPAHLDCWVQTHPMPTPDPEVALWLHGPKEGGQPDVQVVFRDDLPANNTDIWKDIVALCPPSSSEAVAVPLSVFKKWLAGEDRDTDTTGDVEGTAADDGQDLEASGRSTLCWKGAENDETEVISDPSEVKATRTYVVPCTKDANLLGDLATEDRDAPPRDHAEEAFQRSRDKALLRLPVTLTEEQSDEEQVELVSDAIRARLTEGAPEWLERAVKALENPRARLVAKHPNGGVIVTGKRRLMQFDPEFLDDTASSYSPGRREVTLEAHSRGVAGYAARFATGCGLDAALYTQAGFLHDLGKLDPRFQKMLTGYVRKEPLAKSGTFAQRAWELHRYPKGARHELLSAALLADRAEDELLHLIATHHGSARPFADTVDENEAATPFDVPPQFGLDIRGFSPAQRIAVWNPELAERFWRQVRTYGWWGSAYREAVFRLADHAQSRAEQEGEEAAEVTAEDVSPPPLAPRPEPQRLHPLPLPGLDGSNPLAFLAALGALMTCDRLAEADDAPPWLRGPVKLSWGHSGAPLVPVLHLVGAISNEEFVSTLAPRLERSFDAHPAGAAVDLLDLLLADKELSLATLLRPRWATAERQQTRPLNWIVALLCELVPKGTSPLQTVRRDYLPGNLRTVLSLTTAGHLPRTLFAPWDYADPLAGQSLHWEPTEDRRRAYQWHEPNGDPNRDVCGGMLGANRLALEAWPLFPCFPKGSRLATRGFRGTGMFDTFWTWPLWSVPQSVEVIASLLSLPPLQKDEAPVAVLRGYGVTAVFRSQRIIVNKTPNLTQAVALM